MINLANKINELIKERDRARVLAKNMFLMIPDKDWRDSGGDDGQGHYEGLYHAGNINLEIKSWES